MMGEMIGFFSLASLEATDSLVVTFGYIILCSYGWYATTRNGMARYRIHLLVQAQLQLGMHKSRDSLLKRNS